MIHVLLSTFAIKTEVQFLICPPNVFLSNFGGAYHAGGLEAKSWLLEWERQLADKMLHDIYLEPRVK